MHSSFSYSRDSTRNCVFSIPEAKVDSPKAMLKYSEDCALLGDVLAGLVNCMVDPIRVQNGAGNLWKSWNTSDSVTRNKRTHRNSHWIVCQVKKPWEVHRSVIRSKYGMQGFTLQLTAAILDDCPRRGCAYIPRGVLGTFCEKLMKIQRHIFFAISFWKVEDFTKFS